MPDYVKWWLDSCLLEASSGLYGPSSMCWSLKLPVVTFLPVRDPMHSRIAPECCLHAVQLEPWGRGHRGMVQNHESRRAQEAVQQQQVFNLLEAFLAWSA